jgi:hypothetical protein
MIKEEEYLKALQIVQEYEKQLNISDVSDCNLFSRKQVKSLLRQLCYDCMTSYAYFKGYNKKRRIISHVNNIINESPKHNYYH